MHLNLEGKTAIITGGGSGVGREIARLFYEEGGNVAVVDIVAEKARETVAMLQGGAGKAAAFTADVTDYTRVMEMAASVLDTFGQIDVLFNNAGYGIYKPFADGIPEDWALDINVNLYGTLNCTRAVINHMIERHYGKIINIISDAARVGNLL